MAPKDKKKFKSYKKEIAKKYTKEGLEKLKKRTIQPPTHSKYPGLKGLDRSLQLFDPDKTAKTMERYRKLAKAPLAKKVVKKTAKKGIGKKIVSKLGVPGKVIAGAWAAYDVVKGLSDADKESVSTSAKCQKRGGKWVKGKCVLKKSAKTMPSTVSKRPTPR